VTGALDISEASLLANAEARGESRDDDDLSDLDEDDFDARSKPSAFGTTGSVNSRTQRNIRGPARKGNDSDSDFEFDM